MTIGTGGDIRVASRERRAVDALLVRLEDRAVALGTSLWDSPARFGQYFTRARIRDAGLGVGIMTIATDRGIRVPGCYFTLVDTIERAFVLFLVTLLTGAVQLLSLIHI